MQIIAFLLKKTPALKLYIGLVENEGFFVVASEPPLTSDRNPAISQFKLNIPRTKSGLKLGPYCKIYLSLFHRTEPM